MSTASETKLLLSIVTSAELTSINWEPVAAALNCNKKAAAERYRKFKLKLPLPADHKATGSEAQLLLAIITSAQLSGIDWDAVGQALGCNKKAACERYRKFRLRLEKNGGGEGGKAAAKSTKTVNGRGAKAKKRKAEEDGEQDGDEKIAAEGGPVGGANGLAKKRARVTTEEMTESESIKEDSDEEDDCEGEGSELEDKFFEAGDGVNSENGPEYEGETLEYEGEDEEQYEA